MYRPAILFLCSALTQTTDPPLPSIIETITPPNHNDSKRYSEIGFYPEWRRKIYSEQVKVRKLSENLEKSQKTDLEILKRDTSQLEYLLKTSEIAQLQKLLTSPELNSKYQEFLYLRTKAIENMKISESTDFDDQLAGPSKELLVKFDTEYRPIWNEYAKELIKHDTQFQQASEIARKHQPGIVTEIIIRKIKIKQYQILWDIADQHGKMLFTK